MCIPASRMGLSKYIFVIFGRKKFSVTYGAVNKQQHMKNIYENKGKPINYLPET